MSTKAEEAAAAAEALRAKGSVEEVDDEIVDDDKDDDGKKAKDEAPPGFLSYEEYIEKGGDPKKYKGEDAYKDYHTLLKELKDTKKEVKVFTQQVLQASEATMAKERLAMKTQLEAELKQHKADGEVDLALETKEKLDTLKQEVKAGPAPLNPVLQEFMEANPIIDRESDEFDKEFFDDMARFQAKRINSLSASDGRDLTDAQVLKCTKLAFKDALELNPEAVKPEVSPRNDRSGNGRKPAGNGGDKPQSLEVWLKNYQVKDARNPDATKGLAWETYKHMKENVSEKAATRFANNLRASAGE